MKRSVVILAALLLAGCGADGEPIQPTAGFSADLSGGDIRTTTQVSSGALSISLGLF